MMSGPIAKWSVLLVGVIISSYRPRNRTERSRILADFLIEITRIDALSPASSEVKLKEPWVLFTDVDRHAWWDGFSGAGLIRTNPGKDGNSLRTALESQPYESTRRDKLPHETKGMHGKYAHMAQRYELRIGDLYRSFVTTTIALMRDSCIVANDASHTEKTQEAGLQCGRTLTRLRKHLEKELNKLRDMDGL
ncbi:hypothetical protein Tco_1144518 [Tanacetum coccineum]